MTQKDKEKHLAAAAAVALVQNNTVVGLGTGSTSSIAIRLLGERVQKEKLNIIGVATSEASAALGREVGIEVSDLDTHPHIDLAIDGADEFDLYLNLIKGGGGALLREKIVERQAKELIIITDASKQVDCLGAFPLPVEVIPFAQTPVRLQLEVLSLNPQLRLQKDGTPYLTDQNNYIFDCPIGKIASPWELAQQLESICGLVEHGLFLGMATKVIVGKGEGVVVVE
jgi:ribose 5-phosphate isomerase A